MSRRTKPSGCTVTVSRMKASGVLAGPVRVLHPAIKRAGCAWQYDPRAHTYRVPVQHLDDVLAVLELAGHRVEMAAAGGAR